MFQEHLTAFIVVSFILRNDFIVRQNVLAHCDMWKGGWQQQQAALDLLQALLYFGIRHILYSKLIKSLKEQVTS